MKKTFIFIVGLLIVLVFKVTLFSFDNNFCKGFKKGYKAGWCYQRPNCITPVIPACPTKGINEYTEKDGYNRGFSTALKRRNK